MRGSRRRGNHAAGQLHGRRRDDGQPRRGPRRPGRQDDRRRDRAPQRARRDSPSPAGLATDRPHRPQRLRPVQFLHGVVSPLAVGPSDRATPRHAEPGVQPHRRGQRHRHGLLLRVQSVQPLFLPGRPRPEERLRQNKRRLAAEKRRWQNPPFNPQRPAMHLANRKAPMGRCSTSSACVSSATSAPCASGCWKRTRWESS